MYPLKNRILFALALLAASGCVSSSSQAQSDGAKPAIADAASTPIGQVSSITGSVTIEHVNAVPVQANLGGQSGQSKIGDLVYRGDIVRTGADGRLGLLFSDGTSFSLSNNASMTLDEFVYDPNGKANSTLFNLSKGTFTFVAGQIAKKGDMKVSTPVATMGIRGTTPHIEIADDGTVRFSTLIEDGKGRLLSNGAPRSPQLLQKSERGQVQDRSDSKMNLNICRGC